MHIYIHNWWNVIKWSHKIHRRSLRIYRNKWEKYEHTFKFNVVMSLISLIGNDCEEMITFVISIERCQMFCLVSDHNIMNCEYLSWICNWKWCDRPKIVLENFPFYQLPRQVLGMENKFIFLVMILMATSTFGNYLKTIFLMIARMLVANLWISAHSDFIEFFNSSFNIKRSYTIIWTKNTANNALRMRMWVCVG